MSHTPVKWILVLFVLMVLVFGQTTECMAYFHSGSDLIEFMREYEKAEADTSEINLFKLGLFSGYVTGVCDVAETNLIYSLPVRVTKGQILAVVSKYLKNHPEKWTEPASDLVIKALQEAFPWKRPDR